VGLVVVARIQGEVPQQLAVLRQDSDVEIGDQHEDPDAGELPTEPDVMQPGVEEGDHRLAARDHDLALGGGSRQAMRPGRGPDPPRAKTGRDLRRPRSCILPTPLSWADLGPQVQ
jgi:hypothetical protein